MTIPAAIAASSGSTRWLIPTWLSNRHTTSKASVTSRPTYLRYSANNAPTRQPNATAPPISHDNLTSMFTSPGALSPNVARASCMNTENRTSTTMSASTTVASTKSLSFPREPVSVMTAALIVGEKLTTITTISAIIASFAVPDASGAIGSHGHTSQATMPSPAIAIPNVTMVVKPAPATRRSRRSIFRVRPAMNAMRVVAMPFTVRSWRAIDSVMTLPRYGPTRRPNSR